MVQAAVLCGQFFDPFSLFDDGGVASKVGVGWSYVADALVVALVVVVIDEGADLVFEIAGQIIIFKQDPVLQRLMPALDLALDLRVIRCAPKVICSAPGSLDTSLSHAAGLIEIAACHA